MSLTSSELDGFINEENLFHIEPFEGNIENCDYASLDQIHSPHQASERSVSPATETIANQAPLPDDDLFETKLAFYTREFKGQKAGQKVKTATITSSTIESFQSQLFAEVRPLIKREIVYDGDNFVWSNEDTLFAVDLQR